jgi:hypothetical protein
VWKLNRLDGFQRVVKRAVKLAMLGHASPQDRFEIRQVRDVDDEIDALQERAHGVVRGELVAHKDEEMLPPLRARAFYDCAQDRIVLRVRAFEILVNDDDVVAVGLQLEEDVFLEEPEVDLVGHVDQLRHDHFLELLVIHADERSVVAQIEKGGVLCFHGLTECVGREIEAQAGIEIVVHAAHLLNEVDATPDTALAAREEPGGFFGEHVGFVGVQD